MTLNGTILTLTIIFFAVSLYKELAIEETTWVPTTMLNGGSFNGTGAHSPTFLMDMMNAKFANDLNVTLKPSK